MRALAAVTCGGPVESAEQQEACQCPLTCEACGLQKARKKKPGQMASLQPVARQLFSQTAEPLSRPSTPEAQHEYNEVEAEALREEASVPDADGNTVAGAEGRQDEHFECLGTGTSISSAFAVGEVETGRGGTETAPTCAHVAMEMDACGEQGEQDTGSLTLRPCTFECELQHSAFECVLQPTGCASSPNSAISPLHAAQDLVCKIWSMSRKETDASREDFKQDLLMHGKTLESLLHWSSNTAEFKHVILISANRLITMLTNGATVCAMVP